MEKKKESAERMRAMRKSTGMSQLSFAERFGIPVNTLRHWEQGVRVPPPYVAGMMGELLKRDGVRF